MNEPHIANLLNLLHDLDFEKFIEKVDRTLWGDSFGKSEINLGRTNFLKKNVEGIIRIIFDRGEARLFDVVMELQEMYSERKDKVFYTTFRRGGGVYVILSYLCKIGILEENEDLYRLKQEHKDLLAS